MGIKRHVRSEDEAGIGLAIRSARIAAGITQSNLAGALGVSYQQVQNYEKGTVRVAASTLKVIAFHLEIPIEELFKEQPRKASQAGNVRPRAHRSVDEDGWQHDG